MGLINRQWELRRWHLDYRIRFGIEIGNSFLELGSVCCGLTCLLGDWVENFVGGFGFVKGCVWSGWLDLCSFKSEIKLISVIKVLYYTRFFYLNEASDSLKSVIIHYKYNLMKYLLFKRLFSVYFCRNLNFNNSFSNLI